MEEHENKVQMRTCES